MSINLTTSISQNRTPSGSESKEPLAVKTENIQQTQQAEAETRQAEVETRQVSADSNKAGVSEEINQAVSDINAYLQNVSREIQFRVDDALPLGRTIVSVIDSETNETIREFPSKEVLALAHRLLEAQAADSNEGTEGLLFSDKA